MKLRSLRLRLLGLAAVTIVLALMAAGFAIGLIFTANVERGARADLVANLNRLIARIEPASAEGPVPEDPLPDPRYSAPLGGAYWQIADEAGGAIWRSRSLLDVVLDAAAPSAAGGRETFLTLRGPGGQALSAVIREVRFGKRALVVTVAENRALLDESIRRFGADLVIALVILGLALILASALQVQLGLLPLNAVRAGLAKVRHGDLDALPADYPSEVQPLVTEVNALLAAQTTSIEFARARAADLAHGLKTPLTVLRTIAPRLSEKGDAEGAALLHRMVDEMDDRIAYQLRLSRLRHRTRAHELRVPLNEVVLRTIDVLKRTPGGELLRWSTDLDSGIQVDIDRQDLQELVGILLENAAKWAATAVTISAHLRAEIVEVRVADDGPGLPPEHELVLGKRGGRLDESTEGSGLGLSIAHEILVINNGSIEFGRAESGGLMVRVSLPGARSSPPRSRPSPI
jgi:signal transduction histidine kinase